MGKETKKVEVGDKAITTTVSEIKPGIKTSEFWLSLAAIAAMILASLADKMPPQWAAIATAVVAGLYAYSRGMAKKG